MHSENLEASKFSLCKTIEINKSERIFIHGRDRFNLTRALEKIKGYRTRVLRIYISRMHHTEVIPRDFGW